MQLVRPKLENLNIVFKISERCNLKCDYCYFFFAGDESWKQHPPLVSRQVIDDLGAFSARAARDHSIDRITLIFHGGEPLMMPISEFDAMCEALRRHEDGFRFSFKLQTNGVLVSDKWIDAFTRHQVGVGVSLDGPPAVNNLHRLDFRGRSSYDRTVAGLRRLQAAAAASRMSEPGLLAVINPEADGGTVYHHFAHDLGVAQMNFLTPDYTWDSGVSESVISGVERFLLSALQAWLRDRNPKVKIRVFSELLAAMMSPVAMEMVQTYRDDYRHIIAVSSNGDLGPEDTVRILDPRFASMGLNIARNDLGDLLRSAAWQEQADAANQKPSNCQSCGWWKICKAGRPVNRFSRERRFDNHSLYCNGLKSIYSEIAAFLVRTGTPLHELSARLTATAG